jgi:hypothetical protein
MVIQKPISWFNLQFPIKLADKFNHVYYMVYARIIKRYLLPATFC